MKVPLHIVAALGALALAPQAALAQNRPMPRLEWSLYALLIFAVLVAVGVYFMKMLDRKRATVATVREDKGSPVVSVGLDTSVADCVRDMNSKGIGAMIVMDGERLAGIFTERDALSKVLGEGRDATKTKVSEVMTPDPLCVSPSATVEEAMGIITNRRFRHLPVVENGRVVAMISSGDLTRWLVEDQVKDVREIVDLATGGKNRA
jgi:CBS domain-containing protein